MPRPGRDEEAIRFGLAVPVVTPGDSPAPPGQSSLPQVITLTDGRVMRRRRHPIAVEWGLQTDFGDLVMLKVNILDKSGHIVNICPGMED